VFSEFPKLIDRNFIVGFFLPFMTFVAVTLGLAHGYDVISKLLNVLKFDVLVGTTILLVTWLGGTLLLAINRDLYRLLEGYGSLNPFRILASVERKRFEKLHKNIEVLDDEYRPYSASDSTPPQTLIDERDKLMKKAAIRFPDEEHLLPTAFGNTIRAFEAYPSIMYGIDDIEGWIRLQAVIPKDYMELINDAKSQTDFWINLCVLGFVFLIEYIGVSIYIWKVKILWVPLLTIVCVVTAYWRARSAAVEWGSQVKASYDVFLPKLLKELQFPFPENRDQEIDMWKRFSQAIIYRDPDLLPQRIKPEVTAPKSLP